MRIRVLLLILITICLFSFCRKADRIEGPGKLSEKENNVIPTEQAKKWFESQFAAANQRRSNAYIGTPSWKRNFPVPIQGKNGILKVAIENYPVRFGYRDLLFQEQSDGGLRGVILEVRADSGYVLNKMKNSKSAHGIRYYIRNSDFTGDIYYFNPSSNMLLMGWRYINGVIKYRLLPRLQDSGARVAGGIDNDESSDDDGGGLPAGWTGNNTDGYDLPPVDVHPEPTEPEPVPDIPVADPYYPPSYPVGGGGNGNSGGNGGPIDSPKEGDDYEDDDDTDTDAEVTDEFTNPCFSAVLSSINDGTLNNFVSQVLTGMFGKSEQFLIRFYDEPLPQHLDGDTRAQRNGDGSYTIQIALNSNVLGGAAKEYIAATIMHEVIHAYMDVRGNPLKDQNYLQHMEMAGYYVDKMKAGLQETFPGLSPEVAQALAWGGLGESLSWKSIVNSSPATANKIVDTNNKYRTSNAGTRCN